MDADAAAYITAVETADGQALEELTKIAIDNFVLGCKEDGIWTAIKASCILAGARTLTGALIPLAGTAPTNVSFVSGDYNRETGLIGGGSGSAKYINTNRSNNMDGQNDKHGAVFVTQYATDTSFTFATSFSGPLSMSYVTLSPPAIPSRCNNTAETSITGIQAINTLQGVARESASEYTLFSSLGKSIITQTSSATGSLPILLYAGDASNTSFRSNARLAFYSFGSNINLAQLNARVTDLINAFAAAIP